MWVSISFVLDRTVYIVYICVYTVYERRRSMLKVQNLSKSMVGFQLKDISFQLPKGYIMGLIGENGAGKTTLINCILGLYKTTNGEVEIDGLTYKEQEKQIKNEIGFVLNEDFFNDEITILKNAQINGKYYTQYVDDLFIDYCHRFGLQKEQKYKQLSKGEKLKFQFAFALAHKPKLLILDEPTGNFDPEFRKEFFKILTEFVADGEKSVLLATHLTEDLDRIADYITFIHKGRLLFSMDREALERKYRIVSGEKYLIKLIDKERIIYQEDGKYGTKALVLHRTYSPYREELTVEVPSVEDVMYYILKGEKW